MPPRIVFMGSPEFSLPTLKALAAHYPLVGVVTQPDRPAGRGRTLTPPPVKVVAEELGIATIQPRRLREQEAMDQLIAWAPELIVVAAFGQILRQEVLSLPRHGCLNVHASLLPRWRGAAPIHAAILSGDTQTGVTIMRMDAGVDTGDILTQRAVPILKADTTGTLAEHLAGLGAGLLLETIPGYLSGIIQPRAQEAELATHAPMLKKEDGLLDFSQEADRLARKVRAYQPWPGAFLPWAGGQLKILKAHALAEPGDRPGDFLIRGGLPAVGAAGGLLVLDTVQPPGKRPMDGRDFLSGARGWVTTAPA